MPDILNTGDGLQRLMLQGWPGLEGELGLMGTSSVDLRRVL